MLSDQDGDEARAARDTLAAELHALVTQRVSAISVQAMGYHAASDPAVLRTALERIGLAAGDALGHLWLLQRALAPTDPAVAPAAGSDLSVVASRATALREAGIETEVRLPADPERLSATTQHTTALIAALGAAVALGSAGTGRSRIEVRHRGDRVRVEFDFEYDAEGAGAPETSAPEDSEVRRLRSRVALLGGTVEVRAGRRSWLIAADLPLG